MSSDFSEEKATQALRHSFANTKDLRLREILLALATHLHAFVRDIEPTQQEWEAAIAFLTRVGQHCDDERQEFILLSDVLGVSMLVDAINNRKPAGATESTVLGPFHLVTSPERRFGDDIAQSSTGRCALLRGRVLDLAGRPLAGARVDVWQADDEGLYDVQRPSAPERDLRGLFTTDSSGRYAFKTVVPKHYAIPDDGPVGELLRRSGRHPYRPAHIHFQVAAPNHSPVTTHLFIAGSPYLADDVVFGVKQSLIREVVETDDPEEAAAFELDNPFPQIEFDVTLPACEELVRPG